MRAILRSVEWLAIAALWGWCAYAYAQASRAQFGHELLQIDLMVWASVLGLSMVGGLASLLPKINRPDEPVHPLMLTIASHMASSIAAGIVTFFKGASDGMGDMELAAAITVAGFVGAWALEKARARLFGMDAPVGPERRSGIDRRDGGV